MFEITKMPLQEKCKVTVLIVCNWQLAFEIECLLSKTTSSEELLADWMSVFYEEKDMDAKGVYKDFGYKYFWTYKRANK